MDQPTRKLAVSWTRKNGISQLAIPVDLNWLAPTTHHTFTTGPIR